MGKSQIFFFPLPGRKNGSKRNENLTGPAPQISKAQRILGTEAIDLNICTQSKHVSSAERSNCSQLPISPALSNLEMFGIRDELYQESMANISGKASSILGICQDDLESRKSLSLSVRSNNSIGITHGNKSWTHRSDDYSRKSSLSSQGISHSWTSNRDSGSENPHTYRSNSMAHIATYIDDNLDHISELPGDSSLNDFPEPRMPKHASISHTFINSRPGSSASCPVATNTKIIPPEIFVDPLSGNKKQPQLPKYDSKKPQFRSDYKSLPHIPDTADNGWPSIENNLQSEPGVGQAQGKNTSLIPDYEEHESLPTSSRLSNHSTSVSQIDSEPTTPLADIPVLSIPNFMDLKLSGPWNENKEGPRSSRAYFYSQSLPPKSEIHSQPVIHTVPSNSSFNSQYFDILGEYGPNLSTSLEIPLSSQSCYYSAIDKGFQESHPNVQYQSNLSKTNQSGEDTPKESRSDYINSTSNTETSPPISHSSNNSISVQSDDEKIHPQCIPVYIDTNANGWDFPYISSLCIDYDSASSATLFKNESGCRQVSETCPEDNRLSSIYPSTALMEVAQVAKVIRRAPVKEMTVRRKEKAIFTGINNSTLNVSELSADVSMG